MLKPAILVDHIWWERAVPKAETVIKQALAAALAESGCADLLRRRVCHVAVSLADDARLHELNRTWRGKDKPTNVLSFPQYADAKALAGAPKGVPMELGDIVLAWETVAAEAACSYKPLAAHLAHLTAHGMLHLLGFDHEQDRAASRMRGAEIRALRVLGWPDPYRILHPPKRRRA
ncbi:MAG: rRNA maturation RNase YbeY [Alphaproteobacteria bacterium]|nr:MAG: rRNA maturation RNase YbeY [Alphaproteobacteria bacterium]